MRAPLVLLLLLAALPVAGAERAVGVEDFAFAPSDVRAATWETVSFRWANGTEHGVTGDDGEVWCAPRTAGRCARTFAQPGEYRFHCPVHATMTGVVRVGVQGGDASAPLLARFSLRAENMSALVDAGDSAASATAIETFRWTWGDGNASEGRVASHAYATPGVYTITLEVTDENGEKARSSREVRVPVLDDPRLRFTSAIEGRALLVHLPAAENVTARAVIWGDGPAMGTCEPPCTLRHEYRRGGPFTATVISFGDAAPAQVELPVSAQHDTSFDVVASGLRVFADATRVPVYGNATYLWRWGDATNATGPVVDHVFSQDGRWSITLDVVDEIGAFTLDQEVPLRDEGAAARAREATLAPPPAPTPTRAAPDGPLLAVVALLLAARSLKNYK